MDWRLYWLVIHSLLTAPQPQPQTFRNLIRRTMSFSRKGSRRGKNGKNEPYTTDNNDNNNDVETFRFMLHHDFCAVTIVTRSWTSYMSKLLLKLCHIFCAFEIEILSSEKWNYFKLHFQITQIVPFLDFWNRLFHRVCIDLEGNLLFLRYCYKVSFLCCTHKGFRNQIFVRYWIPKMRSYFRFSLSILALVWEKNCQSNC